ncbi:Uncharacterised protein [Mycolicibacterium thermoresistibile]|jgi:hypothetical protein|uniref:Uncharacterized protein n=1 Tax=Mycolicibacterium thermoresistibile TaxID=1797 RepID=A0A100XG16_MYCTH|nr:putative uncharacterized protein [Mycolicibacterium thermoresistibile]SNW17029.1 Uncharacterised protein [Mycolicibacterium thermoresistibile]
MVGARDRSVDRSKVVSPRPGGSSVDGRWLLGALLVLIVICAIAGIVVATSLGQTTLALVIALMTLAVFLGLMC